MLNSRHAGPVPLPHRPRGRSHHGPEPRIKGMAWFDLMARLYAVEEGASDPVVLIHGLTLDHRMWEPQVGPLAQHYRVIRYDLRGFGQSSDPRKGVPYHDRVDLEALLDALMIETAHLVGLSRGG